jgi:uncharacterized protein (TIGR00255 family)
MIKSMTAYSSMEKSEGLLSASVEIRSYNSKYLDVALRIPVELNPLEEMIRNFIAEWIHRGRTEVRIQFKTEAAEETAFEVDEKRAEAYLNALRRLGEKFFGASEVSLEMLVAAGGIIKPAEVEKDLEAYWKLIRDCLSKALEGHDAMRKKEGEFMAVDIDKRLEFIEKSLIAIKESAQDLSPIYQKRLEERIGALTKGLVEIDPARIAQEAAFLADRSDITEEITRSESHLHQFKTYMASDRPAGRKLNFLLQEFNREFNTMGVKAQSANISHIIVELKAELEKIREQVQNVE